MRLFSLYTLKRFGVLYRERDSTLKIVRQGEISNAIVWISSRTTTVNLTTCLSREIVILRFFWSVKFSLVSYIKRTKTKSLHKSKFNEGLLSKWDHFFTDSIILAILVASSTGNLPLFRISLNLGFLCDLAREGKKTKEIWKKPSRFISSPLPRLFHREPK